MKNILTLLVASTALTAAIGVPAWSAMNAPANGDPRLSTALFEQCAQVMPFLLASDDDDDKVDRRDRKRSQRSHDDDDHDDDHDDDDHGGGRNPAPAGTAAPPQNGLFGNGAPPRVEVN